MIKDDGAVLSPDIVSLPVECCRVVGLPENLQQLLIAYNPRVIAYLAYFSMTCSSVTYFAVAWVFDMPTCVA